MPLEKLSILTWFKVCNTTWDQSWYNTWINRWSNFVAGTKLELILVSEDESKISALATFKLEEVLGTTEEIYLITVPSYI